MIDLWYISIVNQTVNRSQRGTHRLYREDKLKLKLTRREKTMSKQIIVARFTKDGKTYVGKREVKMYDE